VALLKLNEMRSIIKIGAFLISECFLLKGSEMKGLMDRCLCFNRYGKQRKVVCKTLMKSPNNIN
jgi:hypothetical protein